MSGEIEAIDGGEVVVVDASFQLPVVNSKFRDEFNSFTSGLFLPRLQLEGSNSDKVKRNKIAKGNWALIVGRDTFEDLGQKVDILVFDYRTKAMDISDLENVKVVYDKDSDEFKRIQRQQGQGYLYGLEFLVWLPNAQNEVKFATLFMGNPTNRVAARHFKPFCTGATLAERCATLGHEILENSKYVWEGPTITRNTAGLSSYPTLAEIQEQRDAFLNPSESEVVTEEAPAPDSDRDR